MDIDNSDPNSVLSGMVSLAQMAATQREIAALNTVEGSDPLPVEPIACPSGNTRHFSTVTTCCGEFYLCSACSLGLSLLLLTSLLGAGPIADAAKCPGCTKSMGRCWSVKAVASD